MKRFYRANARTSALYGVGYLALFSVVVFLPLQTLPACWECKGMAATLEEGTAPKPVQVNAAARPTRANSGDEVWVKGADMGLARPMSSKAPRGFQIQEKSTGRHFYENSQAQEPEGSSDATCSENNFDVSRASETEPTQTG